MKKELFILCQSFSWWFRISLKSQAAHIYCEETSYVNIFPRAKCEVEDFCDERKILRVICMLLAKRLSKQCERHELFKLPSLSWISLYLIKKFGLVKARISDYSDVGIGASRWKIFNRFDYTAYHHHSAYARAYPGKGLKRIQTPSSLNNILDLGTYIYFHNGFSREPSVMLSGFRSNIKMAEIQNIENLAVYFPSDLRIKYPGWN